VYYCNRLKTDVSDIHKHCNLIDSSASFMYRRSALPVFKNQHLIDGEHVHHAVYTGAVRAPYGLWPSSRPHVRAVLERIPDRSEVLTYHGTSIEAPPDTRG
jgi:hypothetical protein